jgi:hypothetical protein
VAAEITRRLLPKLDTACREYARRLEELRTAERARVEAAHRLHAIPGMSEPRRSHHDRTKTAYNLAWDGKQRGTSYWSKPRARVEVDADRATAETHVRMELSGLSPAQAERVLRAVIEGGDA